MYPLLRTLLNSSDAHAQKYGTIITFSENPLTAHCDDISGTKANALDYDLPVANL